MKVFALAVLLTMLLAACGRSGEAHPEVLAAFNDYRDRMGLEMRDDQAECFAAVHEDAFGRERAIRMFREPQAWMMEMISEEGGFDRFQQQMESVGERILNECDFEPAMQ